HDFSCTAIGIKIPKVSQVMVLADERWRRGRDSNPRFGVNRTHDFQSCTFNRSVTSPLCNFNSLPRPPCSSIGGCLQNVSIGATVGPPNVPRSKMNYQAKERRETLEPGGGNGIHRTFGYHPFMASIFSSATFAFGSFS